MKKNLILVALLISVLSASATTYIPFPTSNAAWVQRHGKGEAPAEFAIIGMKAEDTVISGKTYHKLYKSADDVLDASEYYGGLREDGMKRIYFYEAGTSTERLIYDFSVAVGDTIRTAFGNMPSGIVDHIDSVNISGVYHRRINFRQLTATTPWMDGAWIEGIGNSSMGGFLGSPMDHQPTCDCSIRTICFQQGTTWEYHNPVYASLDCIEVLHTQTVNKQKEAVSIFPNPISGISRLHVGGQHQFNKATIYDMVGREVRSFTIGGSADILLYKTDFKTGMYIYRLQDDAGQSVSGRFLVE